MNWCRRDRHELLSIDPLRGEGGEDEEDEEESMSSALLETGMEVFIFRGPPHGDGKRWAMRRSSSSRIDCSHSDTLGFSTSLLKENKESGKIRFVVHLTSRPGVGVAGSNAIVPPWLSSNFPSSPLLDSIDAKLQESTSRSWCPHNKRG